MHTFSKTIIALSMAGLTFAAPQPFKRQTPAECSAATNAPAYQGYLALRPTTDILNGPITYIGVLPDVKHEGIDGSQDSIIVTKDNEGNPLARQQWEVQLCNGGFTGIIRPQGATQHCLAIESTNDVKPGARNSVLDSYCSKVPAQYRTFSSNRSETQNENYGYQWYLDFTGQNVTVTIGDTKHGEVQFFDSQISGPSGITYQLELIQ